MTGRVLKVSSLGKETEIEFMLQAGFHLFLLGRASIRKLLHKNLSLKKLPSFTDHKEKLKCPNLVQQTNKSKQYNIQH